MNHILCAFISSILAFFLKNIKHSHYMHKTYGIYGIYHILILNIWYNNVEKILFSFMCKVLKKGDQNETLSLQQN